MHRGSSRLWIYVHQDMFSGARWPRLPHVIHYRSPCQFDSAGWRVLDKYATIFFYSSYWSCITMQTIRFSKALVANVKLPSLQGNKSADMAIWYCWNVAKASISLIERWSNCLGFRISAPSLVGSNSGKAGNETLVFFGLTQKRLQFLYCLW